MRIIAALLGIRFAFPTVRFGGGDAAAAAAAVPVLAAGMASVAEARA
jgi:putative lipase involved disintegration of autophagic bodies